MLLATRWLIRAVKLIGIEAGIGLEMSAIANGGSAIYVGDSQPTC